MYGRLLVAAFSIFVSVTARAETNCAQLKRDVKTDLIALGKLIDAGPEYFSTSSNDPLTMVKQIVPKKFDADTEYEFVANQKSFGTDDSVAGTTTRKAVWNVISQIAESYYSEDETGSPDPRKLAAIRKAAFNALSHSTQYGFIDGDQGWGGSPASDFIVLLDEL